MSETTIQVPFLEDLSKAEQGSYYTILGAGGDLKDWVEGVNKLLNEKGIGTPVAWYQTNGGAMNAYAQPTNAEDRFPSDLTVLMFPLDGLDVGRLAILKIQMQDRWFDDVVQNVRMRNRLRTAVEDDEE